MSELFLLKEAKMARLFPHFPLTHGVPRVDDKRVVGGIIFIIRNCPQWKLASKCYGPNKTHYKPFMRRSSLGVLDSIFAGLAGEGPRPERIMIQATHLKAHRTAASRLKTAMFPSV